MQGSTTIPAIMGSSGLALGEFKGELGYTTITSVARFHWFRSVTLEETILLIRSVLCIAMMAFAFPAVAQEMNGSEVTIYYSPQDNLEKQDVALIANAHKTIDFAANALVSPPIVEALAEAAKRDVKIRIYLDRSRLRGFQTVPNRKWLDLARLRKPGVEIRLKRRGEPQQLNSYAIDGEILRTGSATFSPNELRRYDNDLVIIRSEKHARRFTSVFDEIWARRTNGRF